MSVVIPAYNAASFVRDAIVSVLAQDVDLDCVVIDDGSTDDTASVAASFGPPVRLVQQSNSGVSAARNRGIRETTGQYVAFLDADDVWREDKLPLQLACAGKAGGSLIVTGYQHTDDRLVPIGPPSPAPPNGILRNTLLLEPPVVWVSSTALVPRATLDQVGGFDERLTTSADTDLALRIGSRFGIATVDRPLVFYRQHSAQMHLEPRAMERDMRLVHERIFDSGESAYGDLQHLERRARANLAFTLGLGYAKHRNWSDAARCALEAARVSPGRTMTLAASAGLRRARVGRR